MSKSALPHFGAFFDGKAGKWRAAGASRFRDNSCLEIAGQPAAKPGVFVNPREVLHKAGPGYKVRGAAK